MCQIGRKHFCQEAGLSLSAGAQEEDARGLASVAAMLGWVGGWHRKMLRDFSMRLPGFRETV